MNYRHDIQGPYGRADGSGETEIEPSRPAGASREHDTRQLHAMTPGLVGQTIERAGGSRKDTTLGLLVLRR